MNDQLTSLVHRIAQQDSDAMLAFYDATSSRVFGVIGALVPDRTERERVMEQIYLRVWDTAAEYDAEASSPGAWLVMLARKMASDSAADRGLAPAS